MGVKLEGPDSFERLHPRAVGWKLPTYAKHAERGKMLEQAIDTTGLPVPWLANNIAHWVPRVL